MQPNHTLLNFSILLILGIGLLYVAAVGAGDEIEVVPLQHRSAEELIPVIRPLLASGEAVSGKGYQLVINALPERIAELRKTVEQLDGAVQQVRISVRRAAPQEIDAENLRARTRTRISNGNVEAGARVRIHSTRARSRNNDQYSVTTLEGTPAYIRTGESIPVPGGYGVYGGPGLPGGIVSPGIWYKDVTSGFYAVAQVHDDRVTLHISPQREALNRRGNGRIDTSGLVTTIRSRTGEWVELGGTSDSNSARSTGIAHRTRARENDKTIWWVKVDLDQ